MQRTDHLVDKATEVRATCAILRAKEDASKYPEREEGEKNSGQETFTFR